MARESTAPAVLVLRGAPVGLVASAVVVTLVALAVGASGDGPEQVGLVVLAAHAVPGLEVVEALESLTWFALPVATLYAVPPLVLAAAGLVAARWTRSADTRDGVVAGLPIALGYVPAVVVVAAMFGVPSELAGGFALAYALVFAVVGGVIGVRT